MQHIKILAIAGEEVTINRGNLIVTLPIAILGIDHRTIESLKKWLHRWQRIVRFFQRR